MPDTMLTETAVIKIDGSPMPAALAESVAVRVRRNLNTAGHLQLRLLNQQDDPPLSLKVGAEIVVSAAKRGESAPSEIFNGVVMAVGIQIHELERQFVVDAYDRGILLARGTMRKVFKDAKFDDIVQEIASGVGLSASVATGLHHVHESVMAVGTPLAALNEICRTAGAAWFVDGKKLVVKPRAEPSPVVVLQAGRDLRSFTTRYSAMEQFDSIGVRGWDPLQKAAILGEAAHGQANDHSTIGLAESNSLARQKATAWSPFVADQSVAESVAKGIANRLASEAIAANGECPIEPSLVPGGGVKIGGVGTAWNGTYYVTSVEHVFGDGRPMITRFQAGGDSDGSLAELGGGAAHGSARQLMSGLTVGIVTNNNDHSGAHAKNINRVKVKLPFVSEDLETDWARVLVPGGGANRGLVAMPEVDDEVLVGFEHGDLRRPYVLGGLWNGKDKPPAAGTSSAILKEGKVSSRAFVSRVGHHLSFGDAASAAEDTIVLQLGRKQVVLKFHGTDGIELSHADDVNVVIKNSGSSLELKQGGDVVLSGKNVTIKAQQRLLLDGNTVDVAATTKATVVGDTGVDVTTKAMLKLEASGPASLKGAIVQVN